LRAKARQEAAAVQKHLRLKASSRNSIASVPSVSSALPKSVPFHQMEIESLSCSYHSDSTCIGETPCSMSSGVKEPDAFKLLEHAQYSEALCPEATRADSEYLHPEIAPNAAEIDQPDASKFFVASDKQCQTQITEEKAGPSCLQQSSVSSTYQEPRLQVLIPQRQALPSEIMLGDVTHENDNMFFGGSGQVNMKNVGTSTNSLKERWQGDKDDQHDEYLLLPSPSYESKLQERIYTIEEKQLRAKARQEAAAVQKHLRLKASSRNSIASVPSVSSVLPKSGPLHQAGTASLSCSYDFDSSFIGGIPCGMSSCVNESGAQRLFEHAEQSQSLRTEAAGADSECLPREIAPNAAEIDQPEAEPFPPQMA